VPLLLITPFATLVLALSSVRTRRSASATALFGTVVMFLLTLLVAWGVTKKSPFVATYQYVNMSVAFQGPPNFQTFAIQLAFHVDHLTVAALLAIEICVFAAVGWNQLMGRSEPGPARFHALVIALLFAAAGMLMSTDFAELFAFWMIGGAVTYLLAAQRWGMPEPAARARVALAVPFFSDICFFSGIAWLYARYGTQDLTTLVPILHTNPGWTLRSLVVAAVLLLVGVGGRLGLWPFSAWLTQTVSTAPPAASAIVQAVWSVAGIAVLYRLTPIFVATNARTLQALLGACAVAALAAAILGLLGNEPRRVVTLAGAAATAVAAAVVLNGAYHWPATFAIAGPAAVLALAPARAGALLAISTIASAMRTDDLVEMGDAWRRMRSSSAGLLVCAVLIALATSGALAAAVSTRSRLGLALGEAVLLVAVASLRVWFGASFGPLRRRRTFDPDRVREPQGALDWPYWLAVPSAVFLVASFFTAWLGFLDGAKHPAASVEALVVWVAVPVVGLAACAVAYTLSKDGALAASTWGGAWLSRGADYLYAGVDRFLVAPATDIARRVGDWIPAGDGRVGRFATSTGQLALGAGRVPAVPVALVLAIVLAVVFALVAPGIAR
jgi:NADH:ubiquinone oxidoreductase subunit 5 (subunit L)/multisubunit Na+/H+ antiporter MnhA subunit